MRKPYGAMWILVVLSAVLLSLPWLVPHLGFLALVGFVPLLCADRVAEQNGVRHFWLWHYSCFVLWNAFTTFWVCNATVGGGIFAVLANALQMSLVFGLFRLSKKRFKGVLPYVFFAVAWIAWERWYLVQAEISWPWLVLGNAFAQSLRTVQWYEFTGTLGGSLWVWTANLSLFGLLVSVLEGTWFRMNRLAKWSSAAATVLVFAVPPAVSAYQWHHFVEESEGTVPVLIAQPNFNPYEKFTSLTQAQQTEILLSQYNEASSAVTGWNGLLIAPETFTGDIYLNNIAASATWNSFQHFLSGHPGANLLFGASTYRFYNQRSAPSILARETASGWVENHNSAIVTDTSGRAEIFHKSKLVVGTELTPYPKVFVPIDNRLGGVMGRCIGQDEISVLHYRSTVKAEGEPCGAPATLDSDRGSAPVTPPAAFAPSTTFESESPGLGRASDDALSAQRSETATQGSPSALKAAATAEIPFGCAVCYESVYPEYCTGYVRKGARFMTIITNDAWWGDTPGYRQHASYASLRAIELRRDIARCGNTGISGIINQRGEYLSQSDWWQRQTLSGEVNLSSHETFFVRHGDITGRICTFAFLLLLAWLLVAFIVPRR